MEYDILLNNISDEDYDTPEGERIVKKLEDLTESLSFDEESEEDLSMIEAAFMRGYIQDEDE